MTLNFDRIDHIAVAVKDLDKSIRCYVEQYGFILETIRETKGKFSGMRSAVLLSGNFSVVLLMSTSKGSQIDRYIEAYGPGIQHIAFIVDDIYKTYETLISKNVVFSTSIIEAPGLRQLFTKRDTNTGMMHEFIERVENESKFNEDNINQLFQQLEESDAF